MSSLSDSLSLDSNFFDQHVQLLRQRSPQLLHKAWNHYTRSYTLSTSSASSTRRNSVSTGTLHLPPHHAALFITHSQLTHCVADLLRTLPALQRLQHVLGVHTWKMSIQVLAQQITPFLFTRRSVREHVVASTQRRDIPLHSLVDSPDEGRESELWSQLMHFQQIEQKQFQDSGKTLLLMDFNEFKDSFWLWRSRKKIDDSQLFLPSVEQLNAAIGVSTATTLSNPLQSRKSVLETTVRINDSDDADADLKLSSAFILQQLTNVITDESKQQQLQYKQQQAETNQHQETSRLKLPSDVYYNISPQHQLYACMYHLLTQYYTLGLYLLLHTEAQIDLLTAICSRTPDERTEAEVDVLMQYTSEATFLDGSQHDTISLADRRAIRRHLQLEQIDTVNTVVYEEGVDQSEAAHTINGAGKFYVIVDGEVAVHCRARDMNSVPVAASEPALTRSVAVDEDNEDELIRRYGPCHIVLTAHNNCNSHSLESQPCRHTHTLITRTPSVTFLTLSQAAYNRTLRRFTDTQFQTRLQLLRRVPIMRGVEERVLVQVAYAVRKRVFTRNQVILQQGDKNEDGIYFIHTGQVRVIKELPQYASVDEDGSRNNDSTVDANALNFLTSTLSQSTFAQASNRRIISSTFVELTEMGAFECFGDYSIFNKLTTRTASVIAVAYQTQVYQLTLFDIQLCFTNEMWQQAKQLVNRQIETCEVEAAAGEDKTRRQLMSELKEVEQWNRYQAELVASSQKAKNAGLFHKGRDVKCALPDFEKLPTIQAFQLTLTQKHAQVINPSSHTKHNTETGQSSKVKTALSPSTLAAKQLFDKLNHKCT